MSEAQEDANLKYWRDLYQIAQDSVPMASEPDRIYWNHPDDDWKNEAELESIEENCSAETDGLIRSFCPTRQWPESATNDALYFAAKRVRWAIGFLRIFTIPLPQIGGAAIPRPPQRGRELFEWLLIDGYKQRFPPPTKSPFSMCGPNGETITFWS